MNTSNPSLRIVRVEVLINGIGNVALETFCDGEGFRQFATRHPHIIPLWNTFCPKLPEIQTASQPLTKQQRQDALVALGVSGLALVLMSQFCPEATKAVLEITAKFVVGVGEGVFKAIEEAAKVSARNTALAFATEVDNLETLSGARFEFELYGHSHGGLVVHELLRLLGDRVKRSAVFGCPWRVPGASEQYHCSEDDVSLCLHTFSDGEDVANLIRFEQEKKGFAAHDLGVYATRHFAE
jgi:hypothetical protein